MHYSYLRSVILFLYKSNLEEYLAKAKVRIEHFWYYISSKTITGLPLSPVVIPRPSATEFRSDGSESGFPRNSGA